MLETIHSYSIPVFIPYRNVPEKQISDQTDHSTNYVRLNTMRTNQQ